MPSKYIYRFRFKHDKAWGWHIGIHFGITPNIGGDREYYLFVCLGKHDFSIGWLGEAE